MDVSVELIPIFTDGELLVVVDRDVDLLVAVRLVLRVVELRHVGVAKGLLSCQTLRRVEVQ